MIMAQLVPSFSSHHEYKFPSDTLDLAVLTDYEVPSPSLAFSWAETRSPHMYNASPHSASSSPAHCAPCSPGSVKSYLPLTIKQEVSYQDYVHEFNCSAQATEETYFGRTKATPYSRPAVQRSNEDHALLRQYLRDTSFQQKVNFQPLHELDTAISTPALATPPALGIKIEPGLGTPTLNHHTGLTPASGHVIRDKLASVMSLVMEQVCEEVRITCDALGISPDPCQWSPDDVNAWLLWTSKQCGLPGVPFDLFYMDGAALATITEEQFRQRASQGGEMLYAKLDIWKSAWQHRAATAVNAASSHQIAAPQQQTLPTFHIEESCPDMSDILSVWFVDNNGPEASMDSSPSVSAQLNHSSNLLMIPTSVGSNPLSPFTDTSSAAEDFGSEDEVEEDTEAADTLPRGGTSGSSHIHLWQFLKELLSQPTVHGTAIRWVDRTKGVFKIEDSVRVARLWGRRKNRPAMNYDKLSRSIRQYYRKGIMKKTERSQRLVYQFCHPYCL